MFRYKNGRGSSRQFVVGCIDGSSNRQDRTFNVIVTKIDSTIEIIVSGKFGII